MRRPACRQQSRQRSRSIRRAAELKSSGGDSGDPDPESRVSRFWTTSSPENWRRPRARGAGGECQPGERSWSMSEATDETSDPRCWKKSGWIARVIKNENDEGWAVEMTRIGESEPSLVSPWTMGRDK